MLHKALDQATGVAEQAESLVRNGTLDTNQVSCVRSASASLQEMKDSSLFKEQITTLLSQALPFEKSVANALLAHAEAQIFDSINNLNRLLKVSRTTTGESWRTTLPKGVSWKAYSEKAVETVALLPPPPPPETNALQLQLTQARTALIDLCKSYERGHECELITSACNAVLEARASLIAGAVVTLITKPSGDKAAQHRELQHQAKLAQGPELTLFLDTILVQQLSKATGVSNKYASRIGSRFMTRGDSLRDFVGFDGELLRPTRSRERV